MEINLNTVMGLVTSYPIQTITIGLIGYLIRNRLIKIIKIKRKINAIYFHFRKFETIKEITNLKNIMNINNEKMGIKNDIDFIPKVIDNIDFFSEIEFRKSKALCKEYEKIINLKFLIYQYRKLVMENGINSCSCNDCSFELAFNKLRINYISIWFVFSSFCSFISRREEYDVKLIEHIKINKCTCHKQ